MSVQSFCFHLSCLGSVSLESCSDWGWAPFGQAELAAMAVNLPLPWNRTHRSLLLSSISLPIDQWRKNPKTKGNKNLSPKENVISAAWHDIQQRVIGKLKKLRTTPKFSQMKLCQIRKTLISVPAGWKRNCVCSFLQQWSFLWETSTSLTLKSVTFESPAILLDSFSARKQLRKTHLLSFCHQGNKLKNTFFSTHTQQPCSQCQRKVCNNFVQWALHELRFIFLQEKTRKSLHEISWEPLAEFLCFISCAQLTGVLCRKLKFPNTGPWAVGVITKSIHLQCKSYQSWNLWPALGSPSQRS